MPRSRVTTEALGAACGVAGAGTERCIRRSSRAAARDGRTRDRAGPAHRDGARAAPSSGPRHSATGAGGCAPKPPRALGLVRCPDVVAALVDRARRPVRRSPRRPPSKRSDGSPTRWRSRISIAAARTINPGTSACGSCTRSSSSAPPPSVRCSSTACAHPASGRTVAEIARQSSVPPAALDQLIDWSADERADVRAAMWQAIGTIGVDDRAYYHLLRATERPVRVVRAAAAWALGRSGRQDAAVYLAGRLERRVDRRGADRAGAARAWSGRPPRARRGRQRRKLGAGAADAVGVRRRRGGVRPCAIPGHLAVDDFRASGSSATSWS